MNQTPQAVLRMFGGVAGAMDQVDSNTLSTLPNGQRGYVPSQKYRNQMIQQSQALQGFQQPMMSAQQMPSYIEHKKEDNMDISKYIGKEKKKEKAIAPNSQLELLKTALQPINDQLEKVCILLGMVYQALGKTTEEDDAYEPSPEPVSEVDATIDDNVSIEEETARLERKLDSLPKAPGAQELGQINSEAIDI